MSATTNATTATTVTTTTKDASKTTIGEDLQNAAVKSANVVAKKAGELSEAARNSTVGQQAKDVEENVSESVHSAAVSTVRAVDDAVDATKKAFNDFSETESGKKIVSTIQAAEDTISQKTKEFSAVAQNTIDELRRE